MSLFTLHRDLQFDGTPPFLGHTNPVGSLLQFGATFDMQLYIFISSRRCARSSITNFLQRAAHGYAISIGNGKGIGDDGIGDGLGTQIVRTLVEGELSGTITWEQRAEGGTRVVIEIPLRFLDG
jgi:hypothetical protein